MMKPKCTHYWTASPLFTVIVIIISASIPGIADKPQLFTIETDPLSKQSSVIGNDKTIKSLQHIRMNADALKSERIDVVLPNGEILGIKCLSVSHDSLGYMVWYGESENDKSANYTIIEKNGKFYGSIHHQEKIFNISPSTLHGDHVFIENDYSSIRDCVNK